MTYKEKLLDFYFTHLEFLITLGISILIIFSAYLIKKLFQKYLFSQLIRAASKTKTKIDNKFLSAFKKPLEIMIIILGLYFALDNLSFYISDLFRLKNFDLVLIKLLRSSIIIMISWGFYNLEAASSFLFHDLAEKLQLNFDKILIPFLSKLLRFVTIALAFIIILQEWGYNVNGFIAGFGLGGLAFALAAQDTLSNFFGGLVIIIDKPFTIGDWIVGSDVEGVVEDINFRSTKIRRFDQALVTIPNSVLAGTAIVNWSKMGKRQITFNLGVKYSTPREKIEKCIKDIKKMLEDHPGIHKETIFVTFNNFNSSSLDIFLYFFTNTTVWREYLKVREDVNYKIMSILEENGVEIAFPSRSIYLESSSKPEA